MVVSILADLSVLMCGILIFFLTRPNLAGGLPYSIREKIQYTSLVTFVGILLMIFSVVVDGSRYDYRFLLYVLAIKYIGSEITVPSILIVTLCRGLYGFDRVTIRSFVYGIILAITITKVNQWVKKLPNDLLQLFALIFYTVILNILLNLIFWGNLFRDRKIYLTLVFSSLVMVALLFWMLQRIVGMQEKVDADFLTRLRNRRRFYLDLERDQTRQTSTYVVMIDIDFFKRINDQLGHLAGDDVLRLVARTLHSYENPQIAFYRIGGEEFAGLIRAQSMHEVIHLLENIRLKIATVETGHYFESGEPACVTVSLGVACAVSGADLSQALAMADKALYRAKSAGRNRLEIDE